MEVQAKLVQGHGRCLPGEGEEEVESEASRAGKPSHLSNGGGDATMASVAAGSEGLRHLSAKERRDVKKRVRGAGSRV